MPKAPSAPPYEPIPASELTPENVGEHIESANDYLVKFKRTAKNKRGAIGGDGMHIQFQHLSVYFGLINLFFKPTNSELPRLLKSTRPIVPKVMQLPICREPVTCSHLNWLQEEMKGQRAMEEQILLQVQAINQVRTTQYFKVW